MAIYGNIINDDFILESVLNEFNNFDKLINQNYVLESSNNKIIDNVKKVRDTVVKGINILIQKLSDLIKYIKEKVIKEILKHIKSKIKSTNESVYVNEAEDDYYNLNNNLFEFKVLDIHKFETRINNIKNDIENDSIPENKINELNTALKAIYNPDINYKMASSETCYIIIDNITTLDKTLNYYIDYSEKFCNNLIHILDKKLKDLKIKNNKIITTSDKLFNLNNVSNLKNLKSTNKFNKNILDSDEYKNAITELTSDNTKALINTCKEVQKLSKFAIRVLIKGYNQLVDEKNKHKN